MPACFPSEAPTLAIGTRNLLFVAELVSVGILSLSMILNGDWLYGIIMLPLTLVLEYVAVPLLKAPVLKSARFHNLMKHAAANTGAELVHDHASRRAHWQNWVILVVVCALFALKAMVLLAYAATQPALLFMANWAVAFAGLGIHMSGLVARVACYYRARRLEAKERDKKLLAKAAELSQEGTEAVFEELALSPHLFTSPVEITTGIVGVHKIERQAHNQYSVTCKGILDDEDRASLIHHQKTLEAKRILSKELVKIQIAMLSINNLKNITPIEITPLALPSSQALPGGIA